MVTRSYEPLFDDKGCLSTEVLDAYRREEDKLSYATMRLLYLFFQRGIDINLDHNYLDILSNTLERVSTLVFTPELITPPKSANRSITRLLYFARPSELEYLTTSLKFYETLFCAFEEYEVCYNIHFLINKMEQALLKKAGQLT